MRKLLTIVPAVMMLSGCGDTEDFSVEVKRPIAAVMSPYLAANIDEATALFPGISFVRTRPADHELLFTIPGRGGSESTIRLRFDPVRDGEATMVHATVDVPPIKATIEGSQKYLSEQKVEGLLKSQIETSGRALEAHETPDPDSFSGQLAGIAVATNPLFLQRAIELKNHPEKLRAALLTFSDAGAERVATALPMDNPELSAAADDAAQSEAERHEEQQIEAASKPMDNTISTD